ncbi:hypothetical protein [Desulfosarcina ovata]|uniref:Uncharacterized protein n=2 Tax=Desulfosarcina ovata TaxID=83564 RepID=A0A5K8AL19_9BACT|nr:hypothetical protein [Desulfosarcina ovata]BBO86576.1 hypothetical protein DSCO28_71420 [Desulfosarcina ovata subsp. sediminis]BBO93432.1 hypothetical protein DSCOOX_66120 [Desulfosarcina ovata subsp. ovata]
MNINQINHIDAGPQLDSLVAAEIMQNKVVDDATFGLMEMHTNNDGINVYCPLRAYSKDLRSAQMVIAKMVRMAYLEASYWHTEDRPDVICRAALRAVFERRKHDAARKARANLKIVK